MILGLCLALGITTFFAPHNEGDEITYLALSHEMKWDLSHYTVRDVEPVNSFPNKLYRADIFLHPPLFPILLKLGWATGKPVLAGLVFNFLAKIALAWLVYLICRSLRMSDLACYLSTLFVAVCPIIGFVSTRLLIDIYFATTLTAVLYFLISGIEKSSAVRLFFASVCFALTLNTKFQAVVYTPLFAISWFYAAYVILNKSPQLKKTIWISFYASLLIVASIGLGHFLRLYLTYGVSGVYDLFYTIEKPFGQFAIRMNSRSRLGMLGYLLFIHLWIIVLLAPRALKTIYTWAKPNPSVKLLIGYATYLFITITLSTFSQERYWTALFPLLFILIANVIANQDQQSKSPTGAREWVCFCLVILLLNSFTVNVITPGAITAMVRPVVFQIYPLFDAQDGIFFGF